MYTHDEVDVGRIRRFSALIRNIQVFPSHLLSVMYQAWLMFDDAFNTGLPAERSFQMDPITFWTWDQFGAQ